MHALKPGIAFPAMSRGKIVTMTLLLSLTFLLLVITWLAERQLQGPVTAWAQTKAINIATSAIANAVDTALTTTAGGRLVKQMSLGSDQPFVLTYDWNALHKIKTEVTRSVLTALDELSQEEAPVPIGQLSGLSAIGAAGPVMHIRIIPVGAVVSDMRFDLQAQGINQVLHRIYIDLKVQMQVVAPFIQNVFEVHEQVPVTTELIQGEVPATFINWSGNLDDLQAIMPFTAN